MALLVDPPQRDSADERPPGGPSPVPVSTAVVTSEAAAEPAPAEPAPAEPPSAETGHSEPGALATELTEPGLTEAVRTEPRLAEPPISGGHVEALMGELIRVLSHSRLARPLPAVILSALGLGGVAFVGLCATAPRPSVATPPVLLPLTYVARALGAPHLPDMVANTIMYVAITLCCLGLAMMLWANSRGWSPDPRKVFLAAAAAIGVLVNITPVGSSDAASYAAYGRIAALGHNPYVFTPIALHGGAHNAYTMLVSPQWQKTPSVYGPVATWLQLFAALIGGTKPWLTIWILMVMTGTAFVVSGYVLLRTAENPVRAVLLWTANPLLIVELVIGGHLDAFVALAAITAVVVARRSTAPWHDLVVGLLLAVAVDIKSVNAAFVALAIAIPLIHDRAWARLARTVVTATVSTFCLNYFSYGTTVLGPLIKGSKQIISPTVWRFVQMFVGYAFGKHAEAMVTTAIEFSWPVLTLLLAWYLYNRLSPDVPTVVAATCALTFAWIVVAPWSLPWYASIAWVTLALLPRNGLTRWLTIATGAMALMHFNGGHPTNAPVGPTP